MSKRKKVKLIKLSIGTEKEDHVTINRSKLVGKTWPYEDGSIEEVWVDHQFEFIRKDLRIPFMDELHRVLVDGGKAFFISVYYSSPWAIHNPEYEWPPICEHSFMTFNKEWRKQNNMPPIKADFDFTSGYFFDPETAAKNTDTQAFSVKHYLGSVMSVQVNLVKRP